MVVVTKGELKNRIKALSLCLNKDATRGGLCGIYVDSVDDSNGYPYSVRLVATDGHLLIVQNISARDSLWSDCGINPASFVAGNILIKTKTGWEVDTKGLYYPEWKRTVPSKFDNNGTVPQFDIHLIGTVADVRTLCGCRNKYCRPTHWNGTEQATVWDIGEDGYMILMPVRDKNEGFVRMSEPEFDVLGLKPLFVNHLA